MRHSVEELVQDRITRLSENTDFTATLFESLIGYAIIAADFDGNILAYNEGARQIYGYDPEEIVGKQSTDIFFPHDFIDAGYFQQAIDVLLATGRFSYEGEKVRKNGDRFPAQILFTLTKDKSGKVVGFVEIVQDLSDIKRAEEELRTHRDQLAKANDELRLENAERQRAEKDLHKAMQGADAANRAKSEFLANMSHEIRTPMNGIIGMTELLFNTKLAPEQTEYLHMVKQSADALLQLLNDILDFSKIEAGKLTLEAIDFDLRECIGDTVQILSVRAAEKGLELAPQVTPDVPEPLIGDPGRLRQILINLIGNAIKFTTTGEVLVEVTMESGVGSGQSGVRGQESGGRSQESGGRSQESGGRSQESGVRGQESGVRSQESGVGSQELGAGSQLTAHCPLPTAHCLLHFAVRDTGVGIAADKQKLIFEAFSQADSSTSRRFGGTGLGLTICSQLVAMMNGRIWVESEVGKGSTFHFTAQFDLQKGVAKKPEALPILGELPVLIVDDNATNRRILHDMLASWKIKAKTVESGAAGLAELQRATGDAAPFRLVLLDYMMPRLNGLEFAEKVRSHPEFHDCEIIMLSSARPPDVTNRCRELNIARWLQKPVKQSDLLNALRTVFQKIPADNHHHDDSISRRPDQVPALRILLAEDGLVNQRVAIGFLKMRGHQVVVAHNGKEALAALEKQPIDVVLMDVHMPEMDGIEATAAIRANEQGTGSHLPIIAMTASAMKGDRERCLDAGMDGYVSKPFNPQELFEAVEKTAVAFRTLTLAAAGQTSSLAGPTGTTAPSPPKSAEVVECDNLTDIIDWDAALKHIFGRVELLRDLVGIFFQECPKLMAEIREAIAKGDANLLHRAAHTLKGSADVFSAKPVAQAAWEIERMARDGHMEGSQKAAEDLGRKVKQLVAALEIVSKVSPAR